MAAILFAFSLQPAFAYGRLVLLAGVAILASWWTYRFVAHTQMIETLSANLTATILASFIYFLGNSLSVSLIVSLSQRISMLHIWSHHFVYSAPSFLIAGLLSLGIT